jgi:hypothetical protein
MSHWAKPRMTVDEAARAIYELWGCTEPRHLDEHVRAILRGVENDALERAAREAENTPHSRWFRIAPHIRALKHVSN